MSVAVDFAPNDMSIIVDYAAYCGVEVKEFIKDSVLKYIHRQSCDMPNAVTISAIEEGERIALDKSVKGYDNMDDLISSLEA